MTPMVLDSLALRAMVQLPLRTVSPPLALQQIPMTAMTSQHLLELLLAAWLVVRLDSHLSL